MIAVEVMPDEGAPQVGVTLDGLSAPASVNVEVSWDSGATWAGVRGASPLEASGSAFVRDFVPPLNVPCRYRATVLSGSMTGNTEVTITVPSDTAWLQDPLNPRGAVPVATVVGAPDRVRLMSGSAADVTRSQAVDLVAVQGASLPVASVGTRGKPVGVPLVLRPLLNLAAEQGALVKAIRDLFDTSGQVVIRGLSPLLGLDPVAHYVAPGLTESPSLAGVLGFREWRLNVTQVRPTSLRLVVPWFTYDDVQAIVQVALGSTATYAQVLSAMPTGTTYTDAAKNPNVLTGGV